MALRLDDPMNDERDRVRHHAARKKVVVHRFEPAAHFVLRTRITA